MRIHVKNGTPVGAISRCENCEHSHILKGYRESEDVTYCYFGPLMVVPFKVRDCSNFSDRAHPTWEQMKDLAIEVRPAPTLKPAGFLNDGEPESGVAVAKITGTR